MNKATHSVPVKHEKAPAPAEARTMNPLLDLRTEIDQVFDRLVGGWLRPWSMFGRRLTREPLGDFGVEFPWNPEVDVRESETEYEITAELPGLDEKDIEVMMTDDMLTLKGEKKAEREEQEKDFHLSERRYGMFRRAFVLPPAVDASKVNATFTKGVLKVMLPKTKEAQLKQRKIPVKGS